MWGEGQLSSATQRPGRSAYSGFGGTPSCIHTRYMGSSAMPVSMPLRYWSHQRSASCSKPMQGPGMQALGHAWGQGPTRPRRGQDSPSSRRGIALL